MEITQTQHIPRRQLVIKLPAFLRNVQVIQTIAQIAFVIIFVSLFFVLWSNISATLAARNLVPSFDFLDNRAGFDISEKPAWYTPDNTYGEAFIVGVMNTLRVVLFGLVLSTVSGVLIGIFLLSRNWLVKNISRAYVEILRNTPLLVQLVFWYFVVMFSLPSTAIGLPAEGIFILPLRVLIYPILLIGTWLIIRKRMVPRRMIEGILIGAILTEIGYAVFGAGLPVTGVIAVIGAGLIAVAQNKNFRTSNRAQWSGMGIAMVGQGVMTIILALMVSAGMINTAVVWSEIVPAAYISLQSFIFPEFAATSTFQTWLLFLIGGAVAGYILFRVLSAYAERTGRLIPSGIYGVVVLIIAGAIGWVILSSQPPATEIVIDGETVNVAQAREAGDIKFQQEALISTNPVIASLPVRGRFSRFDVGTTVTPEYIALLIGLVVYTSAFIGEIVRAGIQAVPYGQLEAARAMGLSNSQTLRLVVMPQALRLIIPPLNSQYLNLAKNSSLAVAIAFSDTYQVGQTMMSQSGQSVTGFTMILITYLVMSLFISFVMNVVNSRFQLKTR